MNLVPREFSSREMQGSDSSPMMRTAALSDHEIGTLSTQELIGQLRSIQVPVYANEVQDRLNFLNRDTLERMLFLARRYCRNQLAAARGCVTLRS